ncbi:MAG TPA: hypothetical protein V6C64_11880 [Microcoleaceae cyanobacterium]|jgi:hypothetical protein
MQFLVLALLSGSLLTASAGTVSGNAQQFAEATPIQALQSTFTAPVQIGNEQNLHRGSGRREFFHQAETGADPA